MSVGNKNVTHGKIEGQISVSEALSENSVLILAGNFPSMPIFSIGTL